MQKIFIFYNESFCIRRSLDAQKIFNYLTKNDYIIVNDPVKADIILFVTCAALNYATDYSLKKIKEFQKYNAELIVAGCLPLIDPDKLKKIFKGKTLPTKNIDNIKDYFPARKVDFNSIEDANQTLIFIDHSKPLNSIKDFLEKLNLIKFFYKRLREYIIKNIFGEYSRFYRWSVTKENLFIIRVSWGCSSNCSYCGIKNAIGPLKSKPLNECLNELKKGLNKGYSEFIINADDIGAYGLDINSNFAELLDKLTSIDADYKISILDLSPRWVIKYINEFEEILKRGKIVRIDIPLQSGNSRVLKLMRRFSDINQIKQFLIRFKKAYPPIILDARLIIGFPSETEKEFIDTLNIIKEINFSSGYLYPFSLKEGTDAEKINPKISNQEIKKRTKNAKKCLRNFGYNFIKVPKEKFYFFEKKIKK